MLFLWMGSKVSYFYFFAGLAYFSPDLRVYATSAAPPSHRTPIHKGIHKGGRREAPPPFVEAARSAASFMDGCVVAGGAADVAETHKSGEK